MFALETWTELSTDARLYMLNGERGEFLPNMSSANSSVCIGCWEEALLLSPQPPEWGLLVCTLAWLCLVVCTLAWVCINWWTGALLRPAQHSEGTSSLKVCIGFWLGARMLPNLNPETSVRYWIDLEEKLLLQGNAMGVRGSLGKSILSQNLRMYRDGSRKTQMFQKIA